MQELADDRHNLVFVNCAVNSRNVPETGCCYSANK